MSGAESGADAAGLAVAALAEADRLLRSGDHVAAGRLYAQVLRAQPERADAWSRLGEVYHALGRMEDAADCFDESLRLQPDSAVDINLGLALLQAGRTNEAVDCLRGAVDRHPDLAAAHNNLGLALRQQGRVDDAAVCFQQAVRLAPGLAQARNNLGLAFFSQGRVDEAAACFREAVRQAPGLADAHNNLGLALVARGEADEAIASYARALEVDPGHPGALANLGNARKHAGDLGEAVACYRAAVSARPDLPEIHSNLLLAMQYHAGTSPDEAADEARRFAARHADPLTASAPPHPVRPLAGRRLRVGYVSADLREHPVAFFLEPILAEHDRDRFEVFAYADVPRVDDVTRRCRERVEHWRSLVGLPDAEAADLIRGDAIDVLIDLSGHTAGNRLLAFARKPAPVQASYLGYLGTSGLSAIDYTLTDAHTDPPGETEHHYRERLIRLPGCALCYQPGPAPDVHPEPPALRGGGVTFASLNVPAKTSDEALALWSRVLSAVPGSRLLLRTGAGRRAEERARAAVARRGVSPDRLGFVDATATRFEYLALYHGVDLCFDPFPYNGVTTTCDALWMGVPVLTLAGRTTAARSGVRFLRTVGLDGLVTTTPDDYARLAAELALDLGRLAALRIGLRDRMRLSPLMAPDRLTRRLEAAYLDLWGRWETNERAPVAVQGKPGVTTDLEGKTMPLRVTP